MEHRWSAREANNFAAQMQGVCHEDVALLVYASRLLGAERGLVLHGGGNASVKGQRNDLFGQPQQILNIKGSGRDMAAALPGDFATLDLAAVRRLRTLDQLAEKDMANELRRSILDCSSPCPSIETMAHAFLPAKYILHTHADAILVLTNQQDGVEAIRTALGSQVIVVPYHRPGFALAKAAATAFESTPSARGMVWLQHGMVTWGANAEEAYTHMIELVSMAEEFAEQNSKPRSTTSVPGATETASQRLEQLAPIVRGILVRAHTREGELPAGAVVLPLLTQEVLDILGADRAHDVLVSPPLTSDHLIRTKALPLWVDGTDHEDGAAMAESLRMAIDGYGKNYLSYFERNANGQVTPYDAFPRLVLIPGTGALAAGGDMESALIARDIALQSLLAKDRIAAMGGTYQTPSEKDLFHMEYDPFQRAKLAGRPKQAMAGRTALVTGAAGAIGLGVCEELLRQGCAVALGDLPGERLATAVQELKATHGNLVLAAPFDVTDPKQSLERFP